MDRIRILLGPMPQLLRDILARGFLGEPDMQIVGDTREGVGLVKLCSERRPDVIVLEADDAVAEDLAAAIGLNPWLKILAVTPRGREARMHQLAWRVDVVPEASFNDLRDAILAAMQVESDGPRAPTRTPFQRRG